MDKLTRLMWRSTFTTVIVGISSLFIMEFTGNRIWLSDLLFIVTVAIAFFAVGVIISLRIWRIDEEKKNDSR